MSRVLMLSWVCLAVVAGFFVPITMEARPRATACVNGMCSYQPAAIYQVVSQPAAAPAATECKCGLSCPCADQVLASFPVPQEVQVMATTAAQPARAYYTAPTPAPQPGPIRRWIKKRRGG